MDKEEKKRIKKQVKARRKAEREIRLSLPQETSKIHKTHKKDKQEGQSNTVREWDNEF